jgi:hypothetical protein
LNPKKHEKILKIMYNSTLKRSVLNPESMAVKTGIYDGSPGYEKMNTTEEQKTAGNESQ